MSPRQGDDYFSGYNGCSLRRATADDVETRHVVVWRQPTFKFALSGAILKPDFISKLT